MGCNCGGSYTPNQAGTASSLSSFSGSNKWIVYRADGTTAEFDSEAAARIEVSRTGGSMRKK